jgi:hypothetical protein
MDYKDYLIELMLANTNFAIHEIKAMDADEMINHLGL